MGKSKQKSIHPPPSSTQAAAKPLSSTLAAANPSTQADDKASVIIHTQLPSTQPLLQNHPPKPSSSLPILVDDDPTMHRQTAYHLNPQPLSPAGALATQTAMVADSKLHQTQPYNKTSNLNPKPPNPNPIPLNPNPKSSNPNLVLSPPLIAELAAPQAVSSHVNVNFKPTPSSSDDELVRRTPHASPYSMATLFGLLSQIFYKYKEEIHGIFEKEEDDSIRVQAILAIPEVGILARDAMGGNAAAFITELLEKKNSNMPCVLPKVVALPKGAHVQSSLDEAAAIALGHSRPNSVPLGRRSPLEVGVPTAVPVGPNAVPIETVGQGGHIPKLSAAEKGKKTYAQAVDKSAPIDLSTLP